jgi:glycosyltransferase involved in cell wall biosynthesis
MISVITVVLNSEKLIEKTIQSVINQSYKDFEYIIIDGGSTDGTTAVIKDYSNHIAYWSSTRDLGISHAFNKGLSKATGELIGIINAGDILLDDALLSVYNAFTENNFDYLYGNSVLRDLNDIDLRVLKPVKVVGLPYGGMPFQHSTLYITRRVFESVGNYNINYKTAMDFEFFLRVLKMNFKSYYLDKNLTVYYRGGMSDQRYLSGNLEVVCASLTYQNVSFFRVIYNALSNILKTFIRKFFKI